MKDSLIRKKQVVGRGQTKEEEIKGSLLWKSAENVEMINNKDRVFLKNPELSFKFGTHIWMHETKKINNDKYKILHFNISSHES